MTTSVGIVDSKGSICHAVGILLFLSSSKRLEEHRKPPSTKLPHSTLRSTVIHANIFILTVPFQSHFRHLPANGSRSLSHLKSSTHSALRERSHTRAHTAKHGAFRMGVVSLPSDRSARSQTSPARVSERQTLPLLGLGRVCSRRTKRACGAAMRLCASLLRGVAAPLGCVIQ